MFYDVIYDETSCERKIYLFSTFFQFRYMSPVMPMLLYSATHQQIKSRSEVVSYLVTVQLCYILDRIKHLGLTKWTSTLQQMFSYTGEYSFSSS